MVVVLDCWHFKKKMVAVFLLCVILHMEWLNKNYGESCFSMALFSSLASLWKLVVTVYLKFGLCKFPTYIWTLLVSTIKYAHAMFNFVVFYDGRLEHFMPCLGKTLSY
jgi:hypothetical protein